ncbi:hypothetical protein D3C81_1688500 [compost metagenome]
MWGSIYEPFVTPFTVKYCSLPSALSSCIKREEIVYMPVSGTVTVKVIVPEFCIQTNPLPEYPGLGVP